MKNSFRKTLTILIGISISVFILAKSTSIQSHKLGQTSLEELGLKADSTGNYSAYQLFTYSVPGSQFIQSIKLK